MLIEVPKTFGTAVILFGDLGDTVRAAIEHSNRERNLTHAMPARANAILQDCRRLLGAESAPSSRGYSSAAEAEVGEERGCEDGQKVKPACGAPPPVHLVGDGEDRLIFGVP